VGLGALSIVTSALVLVQPYLTKLMIDDALLAGRFDLLLLIAGSIFVVALVATLLSGLNRYLHTRVSGRVLFDIRETVYRHLQTLSPAFFSRNSSGDLLSRLDNDVAELQRFAIDSLFAATSAVLGLLGTVAFMLLLSWKLALIAFALVPLQWFYLRFMRERVQRHTRKTRESASDVTAFLVETMPAMKFIQSTAAEEREARRLGALNHHYLDDLLNLQLVQFATSSVPGTLTSAARAMVFVIGGYWVIQGQMALGSLIAFNAYLGMATGPVQGLLGLYMALQRVAVSMERVHYLMGAQPDVTPTDGHDAPAAPAAIEFEDVTFAYPGEDRNILRHAHCVVPAGACIGLHSDSGSGKTTLVDLLLRHYDPDSGAIRVGGTDLRAMDRWHWRQRVALVSQDTTLFRGSIRDNIRYARPDADDGEVARAARAAQLDGLLSRLPQGLDTAVGDRGTRLSGGERQRIAIARALLQDPLLVILDEATSAVDTETEREILRAVNALFAGRTRLVISHRASALADCDTLLAIEDGALVQRNRAGADKDPQQATQGEAAGDDRAGSGTHR